MLRPESSILGTSKMFDWETNLSFIPLILSNLYQQDLVFSKSVTSFSYFALNVRSAIALLASINLQ